MVEAYMPYSQALYELAKDAKKEETWMQDLEKLALIWKENPDFVAALAHPKCKKEQKREWIKNLFSTSLDEILYRFLLVMIDHDKIHAFPSLYEAYKQCFQIAHKIERVSVRSASVLDQKQIDSLKAMLESKLNVSVDLDIQVDPTLIAGLRVQTKDLVLDNTVLSKIDAMKESLLEK